MNRPFTHARQRSLDWLGGSRLVAAALFAASLLVAFSPPAAAAPTAQSAPQSAVSTPPSGKSDSSSTDRGPARTKAGQPGTRAADFILTDSAGHRHHLARVTSDIVVLEWTCPKHEGVEATYQKKAPQKLAAKFATRGVSWFAIYSPLSDRSLPKPAEATQTEEAATDSTPSNDESQSAPQEPITQKASDPAPPAPNAASPSYDARTVNHWRKQQRLQYPVLMDRSGNVARKYAIERPGTYVIIYRSRVVYRGRLDNSADNDRASAISYVDRALREILAGHRVSIPLSEGKTSKK